MKRILYTGLTGLTVLSASLFADGKPAADNSVQNRETNGITAQSQGTNNSDLVLTQGIREALVAEPSLSTYARNVKIITDKGKVTLKGPVRSQEEREMVVALAKRVAGKSPVQDSLEVAPLGE